MLRQALNYFPVPSLVATALILFFAVFVGALCWVFRPAAREDYSRFGLRVLDNDEKVD